MTRQSRRCRLAFDDAADWNPMRVLLLQPEDSPERGPWSRQHWDFIVDLGKSTPFTEERWVRACGCTVLRADSFRQGIADAKGVREMFSTGRGRLIDEEGIDWWDLLSLLVAPYALTLPGLLSVAKQISPSAELWATRPGGGARLVSLALGSSLQTFEPGGLARSAARAMHYAGLLRRFSPPNSQRSFWISMTPAIGGAPALPRARGVAPNRWCFCPALTATYREWPPIMRACSR